MKRKTHASRQMPLTACFPIRAARTHAWHGHEVSKMTYTTIQKNGICFVFWCNETKAKQKRLVSNIVHVVFYAPLFHSRIGSARSYSTLSSTSHRFHVSFVLRDGCWTARGTPSCGMHEIFTNITFKNTFKFSPNRWVLLSTAPCRSYQ